MSQPIAMLYDDYVPSEGTGRRQRRAFTCPRCQTHYTIRPGQVHPVIGRARRDLAEVDPYAPLWLAQAPNIVRALGGEFRVYVCSMCWYDELDYMRDRYRRRVLGRDDPQERAAALRALHGELAMRYAPPAPRPIRSTIQR